MTALARNSAVGLSNPYLDAFLHLTGGRRREHVLAPWEHNLWLRAVRARVTLSRQFSWAIPGERALRTLLALSPLVEIAAGGGYWTHLLRQRGADVVDLPQWPGIHDRLTVWDRKEAAAA